MKLEIDHQNIVDNEHTRQKQGERKYMCLDVAKQEDWVDTCKKLSAMLLERINFFTWGVMTLTLPHACHQAYHTIWHKF